MDQKEVRLGIYEAAEGCHVHALHDITLQGIWFEMSLDGGGVKDELDGLCRFALVDLEPAR